MTEIDQVHRDCPVDVVDRLLWRNAQAILRRHVVRLDGTCQWCGHQAPCSPRRLAERADVVSRQSGREASTARNDLTRLLPLLSAEPTFPGGGRARNRRMYNYRRPYDLRRTCG